jgi:hypothetical protein
MGELLAVDSRWKLMEFELEFSPVVVVVVVVVGGAPTSKVEILIGVTRPQIRNQTSNIVDHRWRELLVIHRHKVYRP